MKMDEARQRRAEIIALRADGWTMRRIADTLTMKVQSVQRVLSVRGRVEDIYIPETTRVFRREVVAAHARLIATPAQLYLRVTRNGWLLCAKPANAAREVGTYTNSIPVDVLHDDVEYIAAEMARDLFQQQRVAA